MEQRGSHWTDFYDFIFGYFSKICRVNSNFFAFYVQQISSENCAVQEIMWEDMTAADKPQVIIQCAPSLHAG
jgi:hypothetical protein